MAVIGLDIYLLLIFLCLFLILCSTIEYKRTDLKKYIVYNIITVIGIVFLTMLYMIGY